MFPHRVAQTVKHLPTMWKIRFWSLGLEDPLEKEMAIHSSILAWEIQWTEDPVHGVTKSQTWLSDFTMELDAMILVFWMLSLKQAFSLSSFTFIKRLFSFSLLSAIRVVPSVYLRLLIFFPALMIPACASSSQTFHIMYSAYKISRWQYAALPYCFPNLGPVCCSMFGSKCGFLNYIQISQETGRVICYSHLLRIFHSLLWSTQSKALA